MHGVTIRRPRDAGTYRLLELAEGLHKSPPLSDLLGPGRDTFLQNVRVSLVDDWGYMWVDNDDGTLFASAKYWNSGEEQGIYLDLVHELVHVKQQREGRDLFDRSYKYVARPTELEAYRVVAAEGRRLGMTDAEICEFLFVEWLTPEDHQELCAAVGVLYRRSPHHEKPRTL
ncbi:MAG: hypothetical protein ACYDDF_10765 [Thermoplasmatota archaeon]